jgi:hypothetical protein
MENRGNKMLESLSVLAKHMSEVHPDKEYFGDSCVSNSEGKIISQKCFICGKELVEEE